MERNNSQKKSNSSNNGNVDEPNNYQQYRSNLLSAVEVKFSEKPCEEFEDSGNKSNIKLFSPQGKPTIVVPSIGNNDKELDACSILSSSTAITTGKKKSNIDGGYGWVVVGASFAISMIVDGISFSFGLIYTELLQYFHESKSKTAWIGALFLAVPLMAGPVLSNLVDKYGCRRMTFIGGLLAGIGFALASISTSIEMLYLTFGFIAGMGIGIGYVTAVVSIAFWFDKKSEHNIFYLSLLKNIYSFWSALITLVSFYLSPWIFVHRNICYRLRSVRLVKILFNSNSKMIIWIF